MLLNSVFLDCQNENLELCIHDRWTLHFSSQKVDPCPVFFFFFPDQVVVWIYSVPTVELRDPINRTANPCLNDLQIL